MSTNICNGTEFTQAADLIFTIVVLQEFKLTLDKFEEDICSNAAYCPFKCDHSTPEGLKSHRSVKHMSL